MSEGFSVWNAARAAVRMELKMTCVIWDGTSIYLQFFFRIFLTLSPFWCSIIKNCRILIHPFSRALLVLGPLFFSFFSFLTFESSFASFLPMYTSFGEKTNSRVKCNKNKIQNLATFSPVKTPPLSFHREV